METSREVNVVKGKREGVFRKGPEVPRLHAAAAGIFLVLFSLLTVAAVPVPAPKADLPCFGRGNIEVRLYTDYFCGPCSRMEPKIEAVLSDLVKRNTITLIFVDTPIHRFTPLYAKYFLYILNNDRVFAHVLRYRALLFEAAKDKIEDGEKLEEFLREKDVPFTRTDPGPTLAAFSSLITGDAIRSTPTCVIMREGQKRAFVGDTEIVKALDELQKAAELLKQPEGVPLRPATIPEKQLP